MPPTKNVWLLGAIFLSMSQHILILYIPLLAVRHDLLVKMVSNPTQHTYVVPNVGCVCVYATIGQ